MEKITKNLFNGMVIIKKQLFFMRKHRKTSPFLQNTLVTQFLQNLDRDCFSWNCGKSFILSKRISETSILYIFRGEPEELKQDAV